MEKMVEIEPATQDELRQDLKSLFQGAIRLTLEMVLEEELKAMVGARRFERVGSRKGHRNGTYLRRLLTSLGQIDVTVPRSREGGSPADVMGRYQRRSEEVDAMMVEAYVSGVSQRKMGDVTEALMGERVGRSTVSRVAKRLDEGVQTLRSAPIEGAHPYLYLDATFLDARWARKVENVSALVAYAVGPDGHRRPGHFLSHRSWRWWWRPRPWGNSPTSQCFHWRPAGTCLRNDVFPDGIQQWRPK